MRGLAPFTKSVILTAKQLLAADHPQTLRQLHYQLFSRGLPGYANDKSSYRKLSCLSDARRRYRKWQMAGSIGDPPEFSFSPTWIVDELRKGERINLWSGVGDFLTTMRYAYNRDLWQDQPYYTEIWGEKAAVLGTLRPIANEFRIMTRVCRGFGSASMEFSVADVFDGITKPIRIFFVGDFDPSGMFIDEDITRRVKEACSVDFEMIRLGVMPEDMRKFNLVPQGLKMKVDRKTGKLMPSDPRAPRFIRTYGTVTAELEALSSAELKRRLGEAVYGLIDHHAWDQQMDEEGVEQAKIEEFVDQMRVAA